MRLMCFALLQLFVASVCFAAQLHVPEQFDLLSVNGKEQTTYFQREKLINLIVGHNEIEMEFNQIYDAENSDSHDRIRSKSFVVVIDVTQDKEIWYLRADMPATRNDALRYVKAPSYQLERDGTVVNKAVITATNKQEALKANDNSDALKMLNYWWSQASVEQRQAFLKDVLSKQ